MAGKWDDAVEVSYHVLPLYAQVVNHIESLRGEPLRRSGACIDMFDVFEGIAGQFGEQESLKFSIVVTDHGDRRVGVAIMFEKDFAITNDLIWRMIDRVVGRDVVLVAGCQVNGGSVVEVLTGETRFMFALDSEMDEMSWTQEEFHSDAPMICFMCESDFVETYQDFAVKVCLSLLFRRCTSFTCGLGRECLLINMPVGVERLDVLSKIMFTKGITHRIEHTCACDGIDGMGECHILCNVSTQQEGTLSLFVYTNRRLVDDPKLQHNILSAIKWSQYNMSLLPRLASDTKTQWPFSSTCKTIDRRGFSYVIFVNSSLQESIALAVKAVEGALSKLMKKIPTIKIRSTSSVQRLDGVWRNIDQMISSLTSMVETANPEVMWNNAADMITKHHMHKQRQPVSASLTPFVDNRKEMLEL